MAILLYAGVGLGIAVPLVFALSRTVRYYAKLTFWYLGITVTGLLFIPLMALRPRHPHNLVAWSAVWMNKLWAALKRCTIVSKKEVLYAGPFGLGLWLGGVIFIDRLNSEKSREAINKVSTKLKRDDLKLWMFPEGTRRNTGEIHSFKKGAFHVAIAAGIPVLPIVYSQYYFMDEKQRRFDNGNIIISILPPIPTEGMTVSDVNDLMDQSHKLMSEEFSKISAAAQVGKSLN
ncbi:hypothetical protein FOCC_FOCC002981 [Frankliniella occidentalis]|nr:hypothetical protein FOCC_FOCC002981 [Frankliniella occidentalis]